MNGHSSSRSHGREFALWTLALLAAAALASPARGGGPLVVLNHQPVVYVNGGTSLVLNLDQGPLGARSNAQAAALVQNAIALWNGVNTSTMRLSIGTQLSTDYTAANYAGILNNSSDSVNPVLFDSDGAIIDDIFGAGAKNNILGFAGSDYFTAGPNAGHFSEGVAVLNGFLNVSDATMTIVLAHELGHFFGLDHAQLDDTQGLASNNFVLMYPIAFRTLLSLHEDDAAAVTALYPSASAVTAYGHLTGTFTTAGSTAILGANIWAKENVSGMVYSTVSDYLQNFTGAFDLSLPPGTYTLHAESIQPGFTGGSSVGPYAETGSDVSFLPPHPIAPIALGGGAGQPIVIVAGCLATATFRLDGTGSVGGNCVPAAMPGTGTVTANPYGTMSVLGGTLVGNTISNLQPAATIQLGNTPGSVGSFAQINFQGFDVGAVNTLTIRSGAPGQTVVLFNTSPSATSIGGLLQAVSGNGGPPPVIYLHNPNGITVISGGVVTALSGLTVDTLGNTNLIGQMLVNQGTLDGGSSLSLLSARVTGGGAFKGNALFLGTFGHANNPVSGSHFLSNGLQLSPSTGNLVTLTLNLYGPAPQILNLKVNGDALVSMPSAWPGGSTLPPNNLPVLQGATRPPGAPDPAYGGGSMIVQATGTMALVGHADQRFRLPRRRRAQGRRQSQSEQRRDRQWLDDHRQALSGLVHRITEHPEQRRPHPDADQQSQLDELQHVSAGGGADVDAGPASERQLRLLAGRCGRPASQYLFADRGNRGGRTVRAVRDQYRAGQHVLTHYRTLRSRSRITPERPATTARSPRLRCARSRSA